MQLFFGMMLGYDAAATMTIVGAGGGAIAYFWYAGYTKSKE